ncbi:MAG: hypothetical protein MZU97_11760 [Bacillus subtilis]|nr:hypothetical protein [Bacillus subtilis]
MIRSAQAARPPERRLADAEHFETGQGLPRRDAHRVRRSTSRSVRGLDYYTYTVFELEADLPTLGAQATTRRRRALQRPRRKPRRARPSRPSASPSGWNACFSRSSRSSEARATNRSTASLIALGEAAQTKADGTDDRDSATAV